ncbi:N-acetyldiaminopimelate deacetylase [Alkalithermobacter thermoalcaliphilus JW-YL-7 = DSM 7308]|uniref:Amidohydrolase n=1 Tax=Alkalithermobacter thermoalcaliphilus JW-YL-7 = DSM 7308 TaxID=1121328 RepID=A0A150FRM4_CLOPD|nr:amidohydrolase [[Clostridium] paradoxum JW-YL-7 = DSM 7308]SHK40219.1 N-acetyldiaminopimelate deacetylase [[Clostridium] paradoxum JW-YL-7 = DSM 7308]
MFLKELDIEKKVTNHRKILNSIAEIGMKEFKTSKYIKDYLKQINVEYEEFLDTAVVGVIKGKIGKKTIAFRADMDGLNIDGHVKHLCGHDGHMSILLGLIEYLNANKENLNENVVFIFQPAEESPGGALPLIKEGVLEKYKVNEIYGLHIYPEISEGVVGVRPKHFLAQTGEVDIEITGKSGHGAMPENAVDSIVIASNFINTIQSIISRNIRPLDEAVLTIGKIEGGSRRNVIAEKVILQGTIRAFKEEVYKKVKERLTQIAKGFEESFDCKIKIKIKDDYPAVYNDENLFEEMKKAIGDENIQILEPLMISEDFSYYQKQIPGLFFMLGSRNEQKGFVNGLHNINFDFDNTVLLNGIYIYIKILIHKGVLSDHNEKNYKI